jgi:hypothetical protein
MMQPGWYPGPTIIMINAMHRYYKEKHLSLNIYYETPTSPGVAYLFLHLHKKFLTNVKFFATAKMKFVR